MVNNDPTIAEYDQAWVNNGSTMIQMWVNMTIYVSTVAHNDPNVAEYDQPWVNIMATMSATI